MSTSLDLLRQQGIPHSRRRRHNSIRSSSAKFLVVRCASHTTYSNDREAQVQLIAPSRNPSCHLQPRPLDSAPAYTASQASFARQRLMTSLVHNLSRNRVNGRCSSDAWPYLPQKILKNVLILKVSELDHQRYLTQLRLNSINNSCHSRDIKAK